MGARSRAIVLAGYLDPRSRVGEVGERGEVDSRNLRAFREMHEKALRPPDSKHTPMSVCFEVK